MNKNIIIGAIVGILVIGGGSFYAGTKFAGTSQIGPQTMGQGGQFRMGQGMGGGITAGQILSKDDTSITVKLSDGGSKIVFTSASTTILKTSEGTMSDLSVGTNVSVQGTANSDGSVNAQSIQIRPAGFQMPVMR